MYIQSLFLFMIGGNAPDNSDVIIGFWVEIRSEKPLWLPGPSAVDCLLKKGAKIKA
jgi:hypothetical protein